jgi:HD-like signal output (HDOD) protein
MDADLRLCDVEREVLGFDHAQVGGELLRSWALPESLCDAVEHHHEPAQAHHAPIGAALVNIANALARHAHPLRTAQDNTTLREVPPLLLDDYSLKVTGLTREKIERLEPDIEAQVLDLVRILLPKAA